MTAVEEFKIGSTLGGKYRIEECLGQGGMGSVYRVTHLYLNKEFALKAVNNRVATDVAVQRFQQEAKMATLLDHPSLVKVHDFGVFDDATPYLVMDLIDGITFAELLKQNGPISIDDVPVLFSQVCFALLSAHECGIVHRDIKPGNIMLCTKVPKRAEGSVKIVDFGIAKLLFREAGEIQALTKTGEIFGSPLYMSPEQCFGDVVDNRSDIYSLGCVLFEMLTGTPPYVGPTALNTMMLHDAAKPPTLKEASLGKEFPPALERVVGKMLARLPADRYENIGEVALSLTRACGGDSSHGSSNRSVKSTQSKPSESVTLSTNQLTMIVVSTAVVSATFGALGLKFWDAAQLSTTAPQSSSAASTPKTTASHSGTSETSSGLLELVDPKSTFEEAVKSLENVEPITSTITGSGASRKRTIFYPPFSIGTVLEYNGIKGSRVLTTAGGTREYDKPDAPLTLDVEKIADAFVAVPSIVTKIQPDLFSGLFIRLPKLESGAADAKRPNDLASTLEGLSHWTKLEALGLHYFVFNTNVFEKLDSLGKLHCLELNHCRFDAQKFAGQKFWSNLDILSINYCGNVDPILMKLSGSSKLQVLNIIGSDFSALSISSLKKCKNLIELNVSADKVDDALLDALKALKSVRIVWLAGPSYKTAHVKKLLSYPQIRDILLDHGGSKSEHEAITDERVHYVDPLAR